VRGVWTRHDLLTKERRLLRLEKEVADRPLELSDEQIRLLERFSPEFGLEDARSEVGVRGIRSLYRRWGVS
jgi:hypothetical protein